MTCCRGLRTNRKTSRPLRTAKVKFGNRSTPNQMQVKQLKNSERVLAALLLAVHTKHTPDGAPRCITPSINQSP